MSNEHRAKKIKIMDMLEGYPSLAGTNIDGLIEAMARACVDCAVDSVAAACARFARGEIEGRNHAFAPSAEELAIQARLFQRIEDARTAARVPMYNGLVSVDYGHGSIDLRGLTPPEQEAIDRGHGFIGGKNAALMTLEQKREAIKQAAIGGPSPVPVITE